MRSVRVPFLLKAAASFSQVSFETMPYHIQTRSLLGVLIICLLVDPQEVCRDGDVVVIALQQK